MDPLKTGLLDLLHELRSSGDCIIVGGGFGLYLKRQHITSSGQRTLFTELPAPRATNDLDLFVRTEVLIDHGRTEQIRAAIIRLGYRPVPTAKFMQWAREFSINDVPLALKIDLLVGPFGNRAAELHADKRRVRPKRKIELHAHRTDEAISLEHDPILITLTGSRSSGEPCAAPVHLPQAFPYLMMKLHAFADREKREEEVTARHHALDLYTIVALMTESEYDRAKELGATHAADPHVQRARDIVSDHFLGSARPPDCGVGLRESALGSTGVLGSMSPHPIGILRIREHQLFRPDFQVHQFQEVLAEIFHVDR